MANGLSRRGYARHRGCSEKAVRKALASGRITLEGDGSIDPEKADRQWLESSVRSPNPPPVCPPLAELEGEIPDEGDKADQGLNPLGSLSPLAPPGEGPKLSLVQAQTAKAEGEAYLKRLQIQQLEGSLINREQASRFVFRLFRGERDAWLSWPARVDGQIAGQINALVTRNGTVTQREINLILDQHVRQHLAELGKIDLEDLQIDSEAA